MMQALFAPLKLGKLTLSNRIVMAPLTRMRSKQPGNLPYELNATYYAQRAGAGLIITEATQISQQGQGYPATPGIYNHAQIAGWQLVTKAVHAAGGKIFMQLWHVGRISHSSHQIDGRLPVAPSAIKPQGTVLNANWQQVEFETPRELSVPEIHDIIADYKAAARNALAAACDGVEIHAANGYLLDQFLQDGTNKRQDSYGGTIENRARLLLAVVDAVVEVWGVDRVGVRLSPFGTVNDMGDTDPVALFTYVLAELKRRNIVYVHMIESYDVDANKATAKEPAPSAAQIFKPLYDGAFISAGGYTPASAEAAVAGGHVDAVAFGRLFIANPDLAERIRVGAALNPYNRATFYGGDAVGYTDYPAMAT